MTNKSGLLQLSFLCLSGSCIPALYADQIVLKNGDRVTGSIVKKDGANLVVKSELLGLIMMAWDKVDSVNADAALTVATKDGKTVLGSMALANGEVDVVASGARETVPATDVMAIRNADEQRGYEKLLHPGWAQLWTGNGTLGWAGSKGNARTLTFTTGLNAQRATRTDKTTLMFSSIKATALSSGTNSTTAQAARGGFAYDHNIGPRLFTNTFNDYEYDKFQNVDLRIVLGGGAGFHAIQTDRTVLDVLAGGDFNRVVFSTQATMRSGEAYFGDDYTRRLGRNAAVTQTARMFNDLTNTGVYRINFDAGTTVKLLRWLNWNVSLSDRYLSTPALGRKANDLLYTTGLGFTFAR
ncbi:MAG: hypothetical protein QOJ99_3752 [Bryobacterales bacterium]|jgi:putative salt-induced outer membrane protein YdiY|nr:hypothetical protein [Bryobacterales bacterium]